MCFGWCFNKACGCDVCVYIGFIFWYILLIIPGGYIVKIITFDTGHHYHPVHQIVVQNEWASAKDFLQINDRRSVEEEEESNFVTWGNRDIDFETESIDKHEKLKNLIDQLSDSNNNMKKEEGKTEFKSIETVFDEALSSAAVRIMKEKFENTRTVGTQDKMMELLSTKEFWTIDEYHILYGLMFSTFVYFLIFCLCGLVGCLFRRIFCSSWRRTM